MSVIWELDEKYEVVDVWYGRSVIKSQYKLFYEVNIFVLSLNIIYLGCDAD